MSFADNIIIGAKVRMWKTSERIKDFFAEEHGVSNVVATVILVLIVVLLIAAFWGQLKTWLSGMMKQIFGSEFDGSGLEGTGGTGGAGGVGGTP